MKRLHRSIAYSAADRYGSSFILLLSTAILARLLTPEEFGIYSAVYALTALASTPSREFGGANYIIQRPSLSDDDVRTAFTVGMCVSVLFAALLCALASTAAWFYSKPPLASGIAAAALNFLLSPFSGTMTALLRRDLSFGTLAGCNLTSSVIGASISIALAALGFSFMGPIVGTVSGHAVLVSLLAGSGRNLHVFRPCFKGAGDVLRFGTYSSMMAVINACYQMAPQLMLARIAGFTAVGLYGRALTVTQVFDRLVLEVLNPVIMPAFAARTRGGADLKQIYLRAITLITAVQWPFLIFTAIMAAPIVHILLGPGWADTVPLIRILCIASLSAFAACLTYPVLVAAGRVRDTLLTSLISIPPSLVIVFVASFFGVRAVAASACLTLPLQVAVALFCIGRRLGISPTEFIRAMSKSIFVAASSAIGIMTVVAANAFDFDVSMTGFAGAAAAGLAAWWLALLATRHPLLDEIRRAGRDFGALLQTLPPVRRAVVLRSESDSPAKPI